MIQRLPFRHPATAADVARLQVLLRDALTVLRFHRPGKLAVLNLACGRADETGVLSAALAPAEIGHYLGIDLRTETVAEAAKRWALSGGIIEFRSGDASAIDRMKQLPAFDFIFIRHQNYWHDPVTWDRLLGNALAALAPGGLLACTSYFDREHELMKASLKTRGAEILWDVRHPASRPLPDAQGKSVDRHLAIFSPPAI
ncbi:MAG: class I SAM-dependent methyltransferase [Verrucomicrobiota bacterium]